MRITNQQVKKVLTGHYPFSHLSFSLLITRLKSVYSKDPSDITLQKCTDEINNFFTKYTKSALKELDIINKL